MPLDGSRGKPSEPHRLEPYTSKEEAKRTHPCKLYLDRWQGWDDSRQVSPEEFAEEFSQVEEIYLSQWGTLDPLKNLPSLHRLTLEGFTNAGLFLPTIFDLPALRHLRINGIDDCLEETKLAENFWPKFATLPLESLCIEDTACFLNENELSILVTSKTIQTLELFDLDDISVEGYQSIGRMKHLRGLGLGFSDEPLPSVLEVCTKLPNLENFTCEIALPRKGYPGVGWGGFRDTHFAHVARIENLKRFTFRGKFKVTRECLAAHLNSFPHLEELVLDCINEPYGLNDDLFILLSRCPNLSKLFIHSGSFSWDGLDHLTGLKNLRHLCLKSRWEEGALRPQQCRLDRLNQLQTLELSCWKGMDDPAVMQWISKLPKLEHLDLSYSDLTAQSLDGIETLSNLRHLDLRGCKNLDTTALKRLKNLTNLHMLSLADCPGVTNDSLECLKELGELRELDLSGCKELTDRGIHSIAHFQKLERLNLEGCNQITDEGIAALSSLTHLLSLNLSGCNQITDRALGYLSELPTVVSLQLEGCYKLTCEGIQHLYSWKRLRYLCLKDCSEIDSACSKQIGKAFNLICDSQFIFKDR